MYRIRKIDALQILDSRGIPTVFVEIELKNGIKGSASVPSGASVGSREAIELRDNNPEIYFSKGVSKAVENINTITFNWYGRYKPRQNWLLFDWTR